MAFYEILCWHDIQDFLFHLSQVYHFALHFSVIFFTFLYILFFFLSLAYFLDVYSFLAYFIFLLSSVLIAVSCTGSLLCRSLCALQLPYCIEAFIIILFFFILQFIPDHAVWYPIVYTLSFHSTCSLTRWQRYVSPLFFPFPFLFSYFINSGQISRLLSIYYLFVGFDNLYSVYLVFFGRFLSPFFIYLYLLSLSYIT